MSAGQDQIQLRNSPELPAEILQLFRCLRVGHRKYPVACRKAQRRNSESHRWHRALGKRNPFGDRGKQRDSSQRIATLVQAVGQHQGDE